MADLIHNLERMLVEVQSLSGEIALMKIRANVIESGPDRNQLRQDIRMKHHQALFYIEKMGNTSMIIIHSILKN